MLIKKTALIVSAALTLSLPAGVALADDDVDDADVATTTCVQDQERQQLRAGPGNGDCVYGDEAVQARQMNRERLQAQDPEDCTGDGPHAVNGNGPGNGGGPQGGGDMTGDGNQFGRAGS